MTDYKKLVESLRRCASVERCDGICEMNYGSTDCESRLEMDAAAAIEALQAQLPKRGEWKPFDLTYGRSIYSCSVCEQATEVPMCMEKPMYAYCPNCGAKMEVQ